MLFAINRVDRKLDRVGTGYERYFTNITFSDVARFCKFDICHNNIFTMGSTVLRQVRGIAIGGTGSAQLANISLFVAEHHHYPWITPTALDPSGVHVGDLPVQENFEAMFNIRLQEEGEGTTLTTLRSELTLGQKPDPRP